MSLISFFRGRIKNPPLLFSKGKGGAMRVRRSGLIGVAHFARVGLVWTNTAAIGAMEASITLELPVVRTVAAGFFLFQSAQVVFILFALFFRLVFRRCRANGWRVALGRRREDLFARHHIPLYIFHPYRALGVGEFRGMHGGARRFNVRIYAVLIRKKKSFFRILVNENGVVRHRV